jgi:hypothetical protein
MSDLVLNVSLFMSLITILLIFLYFFARTGVNPCINGINSVCNTTNMDKYCITGGRQDVCRAYCNYMLNNKVIKESVFCNDPLSFTMNAMN